MEDAEVIFDEHVRKALNLSDSAEGKLDDTSINSLDYYVLIAEKEAITRALKVAQGNKARAAQLLGVHRTTLYQKMQRCGMNSDN